MSLWYSDGTTKLPFSILDPEYNQFDILIGMASAVSTRWRPMTSGISLRLESSVVLAPCRTRL